jgi:polyhydroxyalkanoate synthesis repressor PhaR
MSDVRLIKKYPNRRLYDTAISSYITLQDVKRLVMEGVDFRVVDARTDEEITRNILLQVITEQEEQGEPILSTELLQQIIRFYGHALQGLMSSYLESSLRLFLEQQHAFREQLRLLLEPNPVGLLVDLAQRNLGIWRTMQENFLRSLKSAQPESSGSEAVRAAEEHKIAEDNGAKPSEPPKP